MSSPRAGTRRPPKVYPLRSLGEIRKIRRGWPDYMASLQRYGDAVEWSMGPMGETLFFHPDQVAEILASAGVNGPLGRALAGEFLQRARVVGNNGLILSEGATWRRHRRILQPGMHKEKISDYTNTMVTFAHEMCDRWRPGDVIHVQREMERLARRIMARTLFGRNLTDAESNEIKRVMDRQLLLNGLEFMVGDWLPARIPTPLRAGLRTSSNRLKELFRVVLERRRGETDELKSQRDRDLLDMLLEARDDDGQALPEEQLYDEMHNMFLGGYETSSNSLGFVGALLARNPDVQDRMAAEIDQVAPTDTLTFDHVGALPFIDAVVKEGLRMYPPVYALPGHVVKRDTTICGYDFQAGQRIILSPYATQRDPRWFANPEEFRPGRWLDGSTTGIPRFCWIPFGGGPRVCYGQHFAMVEMIITLATIVRRFRLALPTGTSRDIKTKLSPTFMLTIKNDAVVLASR